VADEESPQEAAHEEPVTPSPEAPEPAKAADGSVAPAEFGVLSDEEKDDPILNIRSLMDINMKMSIELGRTTLNLREILSLKNGSVVELDKLAGDPVDIYVNDKHIASGEVVVIDDSFGVRLTDIAIPDVLIENATREGTGEKA